MNHKKILTWRNGRAFCQYDYWEDYQEGFYRRCGCKSATKHKESASLLRDSQGFFAACNQVFAIWPITSLVHLTNTAINHKAWIGHAANFLHHNSCEECTVRGWHLLNPEEQAEANRVADIAVKKWIESCEKENCQRQSSQLELAF
jgi:hypothetical protein